MVNVTGYYPVDNLFLFSIKQQEYILKNKNY